jgi:hypothetical protein
LDGLKLPYGQPTTLLETFPSPLQTLKEARKITCQISAWRKCEELLEKATSPKGMEALYLMYLLSDQIVRLSPYYEVEDINLWAQVLWSRNREMEYNPEELKVFGILALHCADFETTHSLLGGIVGTFWADHTAVICLLQRDKKNFSNQDEVEEFLKELL